ncbi:hypothetical protein [Xenorhabdus bovienii]|uniref:Uncharacterized protein n=1 Tax=Xenorhabdus bovienii str. kraussei Becker Underwood TaxID=1398204 RepID=A0A077Q2M0_XENBV|nr:hypothetical protein [Xenorhabdus bovienii]CDH26259.1 conserved hypothetical protein [Xenorhabdus bovienii str. kraussei Becker Underwood]
MAKHLTHLDIEKILGALDGWQGKLTWDSLCDAVVKHIGKRPTRQSLNSNKQIKLAFLNKKSRLKGDSEDTKIPPSLAIAGQRIKRLEEENSRLRSENFRLLEKYIVWQYNAYRHGLSEEKLNMPLPAIDRESSK